MKWLWAIPIIAVLYVLFEIYLLPKLKGHYGEFRVQRAIGEEKEGELRIVNDVTISVDGKLSQIDHIVISNRGILCIETKNYSGRIYGSEEQHQWTQVLAYGKTKNKFYNPRKQNWTHVKRLEQLLNEAYPIYSVVVFVKNNTSFIKARNVIGLRDLRSYVASFGTENSLSSDQIEKLFVQISDLKEDDAEKKKEHIQEIQNTKTMLGDNICPRCGGDLVLRHGKYGDFYGCSNYPECRFIKKNK